MADQEPTFWQSVWAWLKKMSRTVFAPLLAILLVVGAGVLFFAFGMKNAQIGGLLGKLFGKEKAEGKKVVDIANSVPEGRVDANGNLIPPGTPDSQGITQAKVVAIEKPGLFDDPKQVKIVPPGETKPVVIDLPDGVEAKDVDKIIVVKPEVLVVTVKDSSKVTPQRVDDLLKKYTSP